MKQKIKHYIKEIVTFFIVMGIFMNVVSIYKSSNLNKMPLAEFELKLIDSTKYKLPKNEPVVIHFWATWCPVCKTEAANIEYISKHYKLLSIAVNSGTDEELKQYMNKRKLNFKVFNDQNANIANSFNVKVYPTTFIYDKNKKLIFSEVGYTSTFGLLLRVWWAGL